MTNKKGKKQISIEKAAKELFWKHGFKRVSVEEICKRAGTSKMTFYRFYPNKIDLAKAIYVNVINDANASFHKIMNDKSSPEDKLKNLLLLKLNGTNNISKEFLKDFYSSNESGMAEFIQTRTSEAWQFIIEDFKIAQKKGIFRNDFKPEIIFIMAQRLIELYNDPDVLTLYGNPQDVIMEITNLFMYGIAPRK